MNAESRANLKATEAEPGSVLTAAPLWIIMVTLVLMFLGGWFFDSRGGWFEAGVYAPFNRIPENFLPPPPTGPDFRRAKALFEANCAQCHNVDGSGKPGQAPPLAGSEWVLTKGVNRLVRIPRVGLAGAVEVKGQSYNMNMAAMGAKATYNAEDLAAILSYIRVSFGNKAEIVTPEQVQAVDTDVGNRSQQYTADELKKLPE